MRNSESLEILVKDFVNIYKDVPDIMLDKKLEPQFWFRIPPITVDEKKEAAHYFLLCASITETAVIGNSRNVRILLHYLHNTCGKDLYTIQNESKFKDLIREHEKKYRFFSPLGEKKDQIPGILASVNKFVKEKAEGNLVKYSADLASEGKKPRDFVEILGKNVRRLGGAQKGKAWLYMRWMVRDLKVFKHFSPKDLFVPLTMPTLRVAVALNLVDDKIAEHLRSAEKIKRWWKNHDAVHEAYVKIKQYAEKQFPDDHLKVDYPFFVLGRWLSGFELNREVLWEHLSFFKEVYERIRKPPFQYLVQKRHEWGLGPGYFEESVAKTLEAHGIHIEYEPLQFNLPNNKSYTPDFIYPKTVNGKKLFLEPRGMKGLKEALMKCSLFRETYGKYCAIALIVPENMINSVKQEKKAYDYLWSKSNLSKELKSLETCAQNNNNTLTKSLFY